MSRWRRHEARSEEEPVEINACMCGPGEEASVVVDEAAVTIIEAFPERLVNKAQLVAGPGEVEIIDPAQLEGVGRDQFGPAARALHRPDVQFPGAVLGRRVHEVGRQPLQFSADPYCLGRALRRRAAAARRSTGNRKIMATEVHACSVSRQVIPGTNFPLRVSLYRGSIHSPKLINCFREYIGQCFKAISIAANPSMMLSTSATAPKTS